MQDIPARRSNKDRSKTTRAMLIAVARKFFLKKGYAETSTPEIVSAANVTRGALYHHFQDKLDLFRAVVAEESQAVAEQIALETINPKSALDALVTGTEAYFTALAVPGRTRLLILDGPAVLGHAEMDRIDKQTGGEQLRQGLAFAKAHGALEDAPLDALSDLLSAAFDRAALAIAEGKPADNYKSAIRLILSRLLEDMA